MAYKKTNSGYLPFIEKSKVASPFTDINNRAKIENSLKCSFGSERIVTNSLNKVISESGPNGETVYESDNGDSRLRFVGEWNSIFANVGMYLQGSDTSYCEVTFYGTGLNMLMWGNTSFGTTDIQAFIDGSPTGIDITPANFDDVLISRNVKTLQVISVAEGLSLGWHTVKIQRVTDALNNFNMYGVDIINTSSQITVASGSAHGNGYEYTVESPELIDHSIGFDNIADVDLDVNGGRVCVYIDPANGLIKKRINKVAASPAYLGSTDHSNESVYRVINFREFGRQISTDFSTLAGSVSDRYFTLDDNNTTLVANDVSVQNETLLHSNIGDSWTITFTGTGLDVLRRDNSDVVSAQNNTVLVDGVSVGVASTNGSTKERVEKICSGLPYGTHTVEIIMSDSATYSYGIKDFIVYHPKKPSLPKGAVELADYNIVADYIGSAIANEASVSTGVVRHHSYRELVYTGNWGLSGDVVNLVGGIQADTTVSGATATFKFFGTGFVYKYRTNTNRTNSMTIELDGSTDFSSITNNVVGNGIWNPATGNLNTDVAANNGNELQISGLTLGWHTVVFTQNDTQSMAIEAIDVITPIHSPNINVGNLSLKDCRNFDSTKDINKTAKSKSFATVNIDSVNNTVRYSKGVVQILKVGTSLNIVYFDNVAQNDNIAPVLGGTTGNQEYTNFKAFLTGDVEAVKNFAVGLVSFNSATGAESDRSYQICDFKGILQKDKLEEEES